VKYGNAARVSEKAANFKRFRLVEEFRRAIGRDRPRKYWQSAAVYGDLFLSIRFRPDAN